MRCVDSYASHLSMLKLKEGEGFLISPFGFQSRGILERG